MVIPQTKYKKRFDKIDFITHNLIFFVELAKMAKLKLARENRLTSQKAFKFDVEISLCLNILKNMIGITDSYIMKKAKEIVCDTAGNMREEFKKDLEELCSGPKLITGPQVENQMNILLGRK